MQRRHIHIEDYQAAKLAEVRELLGIPEAVTVRRALDPHLAKLDAHLEARRKELKDGKKMPKQLRKGETY